MRNSKSHNNSNATRRPVPGRSVTGGRSSDSRRSSGPGVSGVNHDDSAVSGYSNYGGCSDTGSSSGSDSGSCGGE